MTSSFATVPQGMGTCQKGQQWNPTPVDNPCGGLAGPVVETATLKKVGNSYAMAIVKVKEKFQVTLPAKLRKRTGVEVGDFLEARVERGKITLTPKSLVDRRLAEALEDVRRERVYGPFDGHQPMVKSLHSNVRKRGVKKKIS